MNQKFEVMKETLGTATTVTKRDLLAGGIVCFVVGVVCGIVLGMVGKGLNVNVAIGAHNGSNNQGNGCENQHNGNNNK